MDDDGTDEHAGEPPAPSGGVWPSAPGAPVVDGDATAVAAPGPPTSVAPPGRRRSHLGLILGIVAAVIVLAGAAVVGLLVLAGDDSFPDDDQEALIGAIPGKVDAADCKELSTDDDVVAAVSCRTDGGAITVKARRFADVDETNAGFEVDEGVVDLTDDGTSDCIDRDKVEHDYESNVGYSGRVLCYRSGGRSFLAWTHPEQRIVFTASRTDKQDLKLYRWWSAGIARHYPTADQIDALKEHRPEDAKECQSARPLRGSIATIRCDGTGGASVYLTQYDSTEDMQDRYAAFVDDAGLQPNENADSGTCPLEGAVTTQGVSTGRVFCAYDGEGEAPRIVFTDEPTDILVEVLGDDGDDGDALIEQWGVGSFDPQA